MELFFIKIFSQESSKLHNSLFPVIQMMQYPVIPTVATTKYLTYCGGKASSWYSECLQNHNLLKEVQQVIWIQTTPIPAKLGRKGLCETVDPTLAKEKNGQDTFF